MSLIYKNSLYEQNISKWVVWCDCPKWKIACFNRQEDAMKEAERLAEINKGKAFFVFENYYTFCRN